MKRSFWHRIFCDEDSAVHYIKFWCKWREVISSEHCPPVLKRDPEFAGEAIQEVCQFPAVYFMRCGDHVKIGFSENVRLRHNEIQVGSPLPVDKVSFYLCHKGADKIEAALHERLGEYRARGEWFQGLDDKAADLIDEVISESDTSELYQLALDGKLRGVKRLVQAVWAWSWLSADQIELFKNMESGHMLAAINRGNRAYWKAAERGKPVEWVAKNARMR